MFSVVVTVYNKDEYINRAIDSVLLQTFNEFQLIIVDDGSMDNSLALICAYDDSRIKVVTQENKGAGAARNTGIQNASNQWVAFLDADDVWTSEHLNELKILIEQFQGVGIVATKSTEIKANHKSSSSSRGLFTAAKFKQHKRQIVDYFIFAAKHPGHVHSSSVAIKREVFSVVGHFKLAKQGEDSEFWARVCLSYPCAVSDNPTSFYYRGTNGIMEQQWLGNIQRQAKINSIKDIGFAVSFLVDELGTIPVARKVGVVYFINNSIARSLKISFFNGQITSMPFIGSLLIGKLELRFYIWRFLSKQPQWLLRTLYGMRSTMRNIYRKIK